MVGLAGQAVVVTDAIAIVVKTRGLASLVNARFARRADVTTAHDRLILFDT